MTPVEKYFGKTRIVRCISNADLGRTAATAVADTCNRLLAKQPLVRWVFAAGESQSTFHHALSERRDIDWSRVVAFNVDDFWHLRLPEKFTCGFQTTQELYAKVRPRETNLVDWQAVDPEAECRRYETALRAAPIDIMCQGIGTSGHLALNEPGQADFKDARWVRLVDVAEQSKRQLMDDPNFKAFGSIPDKGITMTIPAIISARYIFTIVPLGLKKNILTKLVACTRPDPLVPASILLEKEGTLFVDNDSCPDAWR